MMVRIVICFLVLSSFLLMPAAMADPADAVRDLRPLRIKLEHYRNGVIEALKEIGGISQRMTTGDRLSLHQMGLLGNRIDGCLEAGATLANEVDGIVKVLGGKSRKVSFEVREPPDVDWEELLDHLRRQDPLIIHGELQPREMMLIKEALEEVRSGSRTK